MGLLVIQHLNAVLQRAQAFVSFGQLSADIRRHMTRVAQSLKRIDRAARAQGRVPPAEDQLLGLGEELDLADAAAPQLQVRPRRLQPLARLVDVDLPFDRLDVEDGGIVEAAPPDEGGQRFQKGVSGREVADHGPRLDEGSALPVLADAFVVRKGEGHGHDRRGRRRVGTQPQVDAEHVAVARPLLHQSGKGLGQPVQEALRLDAVSQSGLDRLRLPEQADVDVGGIVQLVGTVLAHGQAEQAGHGAARVVGGGYQLAPLALVVGHGRQGRPRRRIGKAAERAGDLIQIPDPAQIGQGGQHMQLALQAAQRDANVVGTA